MIAGCRASRSGRFLRSQRADNAVRMHDQERAGIAMIFELLDVRR